MIGSTSPDEVVLDFTRTEQQGGWESHGTIVLWRERGTWRFRSLTHELRTADGKHTSLHEILPTTDGWLFRHNGREKGTDSDAPGIVGTFVGSIPVVVGAIDAACGWSRPWLRVVTQLDPDGLPIRAVHAPDGRVEQVAVFRRRLVA